MKRMPVRPHTNQPFSPATSLGRFRVALGITTALLAVGFASSGSAQDEPPDKVTLQLEDRGSRITLRCWILDYTGESIRLRTVTGSGFRTYPASQVVDVETPQTEPHVQGLLRLSENKFDDAQTALEEALAQETRKWVRREILAMLVRCALMQGDYASAGSRFVSLIQSEPKTRHLRLIPLVWGPRELDGGLSNAARSWSAKSDETVRLLGASLLLDDPRYGRSAEADLKELATSVNRQIRLLARAQLWRKRLQANDLTSNELERWQARIETLPEDLRGGPYYLLGRGHLRRRQYDQAAAALLWLPLVYDHDHHLAARACLEAADALNRIGQQTEATALYREVVFRFRETPFAQEASALLETMTTNGSD